MRGKGMLRLKKLGVAGLFSVMGLMMMGAVPKTDAAATDNPAAYNEAVQEAASVEAADRKTAVSEAAPEASEETEAPDVLTKAEVKKVGDKYYYYLDGVLQKCGWATVNGKKYYFSKTTGAAFTGTNKIGGYYYVFASNGVMLHDRYFKNSEGKRFYLLSNGRAAVGLYEYEVSGVKYKSYFNGDGTVFTGGLKKIDTDNWYYFKSSGYAATGGFFKGADGKYYYAYADGRLKHNGWTTVGGRKYYLSKSNAACLTGLKSVGGYDYYFADNGVLQTNYYLKTKDGKQYYFKANGRSVTGIASYTNSSGVKVLSYFNGDGTIAKETFKESDGKLYYLKSNGYAQVGNLFKLENGSSIKFYLAYKNGVICRDGLTWYQGELYCFHKKHGAALTGVQKIGNNYYVFSSTGTAFRNTVRNVGDLKFKLDENGVSVKGFIESGTSLHFLNGDGTLKKDCIFKYLGKTYISSSTGVIRRSGYFKYNYSDTEYKLFYLDETTGEAITGFRVGKFMGVENRGMFFDPEEETGYRTGIQIWEGDYYIFDKLGVAARGFYCDDDNKKLYYCDEETCKQVRGKTKIQFAGLVEIPMLSDNSLDYTKAKSLDTGDMGANVLAKGFTQMFKPVVRIAKPLGTSLDQVPGYTCSAFVSHMYYQNGLNFGMQDIAPECINVGFEMNDDPVSPGDIIFWNLTNCDTKLDEVGEPWILDSDGDGKCDRIHKANEFGDGRKYHVHHVALWLGNGQALEAAAGRGIVIRNIPEPTSTYYPVCYGHWPGRG
ncbi:MAG: hypothetical protein K6C35_09070 [Eubacterium sp.]|nr:hypothetical protein [Eubacterium sp.]